LFVVVFYKTEKGIEPAREFIEGIRKPGGKNSKINFSKVNDYIKILERIGLGAKLPYIKHLENEIWELRPLRNRILFGACRNNVFVLLHGFVKKSQKTPRREIEKAFLEFEDFKRRDGRWVQN